MTDRVYAFGDVHGHLEKLEPVLGLIEADMARHGAGPVVSLGDLVDRGPDSRGVIERLMDWHDPGAGRHVIAGNHDRMFTWFMRAEPKRDPHLRQELEWWDWRLGGAETLASYGVRNAAGRRIGEVHEEACDKVPRAHLDWIGSLPLYLEFGPGGVPHLLVHAGIRPGIALDEQTEEDLVWIRPGFDDYDGPHPFLVVHGHTPHDEATHHGNRVALDTGAAFGGPLTAAVFEGGRAFVLSEGGRVPLDPPPGWERPDASGVRPA